MYLYAKYRHLLSALPLLVMTAAPLSAQKPRMAIIMIVDQMAYHYLPKLSGFMHGGIRFLLDNGIVYTHAYHPHGLPTTATGHTAFNTGAFAKDHGIIDNAWFDETGNLIQSDDDFSKDAAVFAPSGTYNFSKSPRNIMIDGISDQLILNSSIGARNKVVALSLKSRAAIGLAGKLGKAIWFDSTAGRFTSSKAYFKRLPRWLTAFNKNLNLKNYFPLEWHLLYPADGSEYQFNNIHNYDYAQAPSLIGRKVRLRITAQDQEQLYGDEPALPQVYSDNSNYVPIEKNPLGNQILFDLAQDYIDHYMAQAKRNDFLLLWISLSSLDLVGHAYGPASMEITDMLYHLDVQMGQFMETVTKKVGPDVLFMLSADHGIAPLPELVDKKGIPAHRIYAQDFIHAMNKNLTHALGISNLVRAFQPNQFYLDQEQLNALTPEVKKRAFSILKQFLMQQPGIKEVWDYDELSSATFKPDQLENFSKNQLYPGRSGQIIFQTQPYYMATPYKKGVSHITPYELDTHVPLMIYQHGRFENKTITQKVWTLQVASTLAYLFNIPKPSACTLGPLPGIITEEASPDAKYLNLQKRHPSSVHDLKNYGANH